MDPIQLLQDRYEELTKSEQKLAKYLLSNPQSILNLTIDTITKAAGSSNAAMVRLCQKLGYKGFSEFKFSMQRSLIAHSAAQTDPEGQVSPHQEILNAYTGYINQIPQFVSREELQRMAKAICGANRLVFYGINRTFLSAQQLSHRLRRIGIFNEATEDWIVMGDNAAILEEGDCCVLFTMKGRGGVEQYSSTAQNLKKRGCHVILVTMTANLPIAKHADQVILLPCPSRDPLANFYEDQIVTFLFIELLLYEVTRLLQG